MEVFLSLLLIVFFAASMFCTLLGNGGGAGFKRWIEKCLFIALIKLTIFFVGLVITEMQRNRSSVIKLITGLFLLSISMGEGCL